MKLKAISFRVSPQQLQNYSDAAEKVNATRANWIRWTLINALGEDERFGLKSTNNVTTPPEWVDADSKLRIAYVQVRFREKLLNALLTNADLQNTSLQTWARMKLDYAAGKIL